MADPKYRISNPKGLSKSDFESLQGTALYIRMFRHRCFVRVDGLNNTKEAAKKEINDWLRDNCNSFYYFPTGEISWVYIEGAADAVNFKMRFHDQDVTVPEPPPPRPPKPAAAAPTPKKIASADITDWLKLVGANGGKTWSHDDLVDGFDVDDDMARKVLDHINKHRGV